MKKILLATLAVGAAIAAVAPAEARDGCGPGGHRGPYGHCRPNRGPRPVIVAGPGAPVIGTYYPGRGYYYNNRYWHHRERWHGDWRYR
ncbi:GCG_CRPN prefix-to-repeats domain-containing protein [Sphingomonas sp. MMS24-J13]|uniref:GCG_CRPN prefix-to-repeats domain-containing protein n=1 Tax=Sphingomonas sp. MMS24-J13 TaxID=3238686 RepID=UPI00384A50DD